MTWVKLDDQFYEDEAVLELTSPSSLALYVVGLAYCGNKLNDGLIPWSALRRKLLPAAFADQSHADELVLAGLWEIQDEGGYLVRNFLKFNRSRDQVDNDRNQAKKRMQKNRVAPKSLKPENSTPVRANTDRTSVGVLSVSVSDSFDLQLEEKVTDRFGEFWDTYAKKEGKKASITEWKRHVNAENVDAVMEGARALVAARPESKFRLDPQRWLRDHRWEDEVTPEATMVAGKPAAHHRGRGTVTDAGYDRITPTN